MTDDIPELVRKARAELDDMLAENARLRADLARLRRLSVRVWDECGECGGRGIDKPDDCICRVFKDTGGFRIADLGCRVHGVDGRTAQPDGPWEPCPSCDGTGRVLREGAVRVGADTVEGFVAFPASWMEEA